MRSRRPACAIASPFPGVAGIELRWRHRVTGLMQARDGVTLAVETPEGAYTVSADFVLASDGARSALRKLLGLEFKGKIFEDRFLIADRGMDEDVFVVSEMVVEQFHGAAGPLLRFHGTTEWALDYVLVSQVLWLPREDQLRAALGEAFVALARVGEEWVVTTSDGETHHAPDPEEAYAEAWLAHT